MITVPVLYPLEIGFATLGGWLVFDHVPDLFARIGIGIIAASGAGNTLLSWRRGRGRGVCPGQFTKTCKQTEKNQRLGLDPPADLQRGTDTPLAPPK